MRRRSHNQHLGDLPTDDEVLEALAALEASDSSRYEYGITAQSLAWKLGIAGASRLGNGAVKGTWSGRMAPALRICPRLEAFARQGLVHKLSDDRRRYRWVLTAKGRTRLSHIGRER